MSEKQLLARYRNLLILLARHYVSIMELAKGIKDMITPELQGGKASGMHCQANTMRKQAYKLKVLLLEDGLSMRYFFGTINLYEIAKHEIILPK